MTLVLPICSYPLNKKKKHIKKDITYSELINTDLSTTTYGKQSSSTNYNELNYGSDSIFTLSKHLSSSSDFNKYKYETKFKYVAKKKQKKD